MTTKTPPYRYAGLDGMRAIAVVLVVVYHLFPQSPLRGGFIGVDVFFVISGFLITTLLLREHAATGGIRLVAFWQRRARRLLPALGAVVLVCATAAWVIGGDVLVRLGEQVLGAATFSYNWVSLAGGTGYFSAATPELFRNFWSLAVEEQFYVLWPLVLPLFLLIPRAWGRAAAALALAAASAVWMGAVMTSGVDVTRAYFGTDTHAFGILLGIALAFLLESVLARARAVPAGSDLAPPPHVLLAPGWKIVTPSSGAGSALVPPGVPGVDGVAGVSGVTGVAGVTGVDGAAGVTVSSRPVSSHPVSSRPMSSRSVISHFVSSRPVNPRTVRIATGVAGTLALVGLGLLALLPPTPTVATFPGAVLAASICSAVAIVAGVWPGSAFGPAIDAQPLRWIGDRSYGIYLWHWPLLVLLVAGFTGTGPDAGVPLWIGIATLGLTLAAAEGSYRLLETPVRRYGFRGSLTRLRARLIGSPGARVRALTGVTAGVLLLGGTSAAIAAAPGVSSGEAAVLAGIEAVNDAGDPQLTAVPQEAPDSAAGPTGPADSAAASPAAEPAPSDESPAPVAQNPVPVPSPTPVTGAEISAVGDSVMLASAPALYERFPGILVDAAVSRSTWAGPGILQSLAGSGQLRPYVVIALGTNGPVNVDALEQMAQISGPDRRLVLVNAYAPRDWIPGVNADLAAFAASHPGVVIADWSGAIGAGGDLLAGDQIHPDQGGTRVFADTVAAAVDAVESERALAQYQVEIRAYRRLHRAEVRVAE